MPPYNPNLINYPTLKAECYDTEARSLKKMNALSSDILMGVQALNKPGGPEIATVKYVHGNSYVIPVGRDLLDLGCYNPLDNDVWVYIMITPAGAQPGMPPTFPIRVYAHNHAYYEAYASWQTVADNGGNVFSVAVSVAEQALTWSPPVYLAIRHS